MRQVCIALMMCLLPLAALAGGRQDVNVDSVGQVLGSGNFALSLNVGDNIYKRHYDGYDEANWYHGPVVVRVANDSMYVYGLPQPYDVKYGKRMFYHVDDPLVTDTVFTTKKGCVKAHFVAKTRWQYINGITQGSSETPVIEAGVERRSKYRTLDITVGRKAIKVRFLDEHGQPLVCTAELLADPTPASFIVKNPY